MTVISTKCPVLNINQSTYQSGARVSEVLVDVEDTQGKPRARSIICPKYHEENQTCQAEIDKSYDNLYRGYINKHLEAKDYIKLAEEDARKENNYKMKAHPENFLCIYAKNFKDLLGGKI